MLSAWLNGFLGTILVFAIALGRFDMSGLEALHCIVASNLAGFASLMIYSFGSRLPWIRRHLLHGPARTWTLFLASYFGLLLALASPLRETDRFAWLILPVILTTGFCIVAYGPVQDRLVARSQRRTVGGA